jgi:hypothetical protein
VTTDIGELVVRIKADAAQLERELQKANLSTKAAASSMSNSLKDLRNQFTALVPALSIGALVAFGTKAFQEADHINDLAQRTGVLGSTLSALKLPLAQGGSGLDEFAASINRMNNLVGEAAKGVNQEAVKAFDELGLSVRRLQELSPEDQFYEIARALSEQDTQAKMTNLGMQIFGRSFATLIPLIKESNGNLREHVAQVKAAGGALTEEDLKRIDELGDRWTAALDKAKKQLLEVVPLVEQLANLPDYLRAAFIEIPFMAGDQIGRKLAGQPSVGSVSTERPATLSNEEVARRIQEGLGTKNGGASARGSNAGLLKPTSEQKQLEDAKKALADYNTELKRQYELLQLTPREQAAVEAKYKTLELAQKAGVKNTDELVQKNMELARSNYDLNTSMQESVRFMQELKDRSTSALTDIAFGFDSASGSALQFAEAIARIAFEKKIAGPLVDGLFGSGGNPGLVDSLLDGFGGFFADGGIPPVGKPSIVGERGPEVFVPRSAGTIVPNHALGGSQVVVQQTINLSPGLPETVNAAIARAAPAIAAQAQTAVFQAIERGGTEARLVGRRN